MTSKFSPNESKYLSRNPVKQFLLNKFLFQICKLVKEINPRTVLDAGCGEGFIADRLLKIKPSLDYTGLDTSQIAIEKARQNVKKAKFIISDINKIPFPNGNFDLVICLEVLEHLSDPEKGLFQLFRVTNKTALISVPDEPLFSYLRLFAFSDISKFGRHKEHISFWNKSTFPKFLKKKFTRVILFKSLPWLICLAYK